MVDNEMLILVYETLQRLSGSIKDTRASVSALNSKIESITKHVKEIDDIVSGVINPGIMTIGEGHEAVHKKLYTVTTNLKATMKETQDSLAAELKSTQDSLDEELTTARELLSAGMKNLSSSLESELSLTCDKLETELNKTRDVLNTSLKETRDSLNADLKETRDGLNADLKETREAMEREFKSEQDKLTKRLTESQRKLTEKTDAMSTQLNADVSEIKKDHSDLSARLEVYELKQRQLEQTLKTIKRQIH